MKKTPLTRIRVTVIETVGESALVQYQTGATVERKYIPIAEIGDKQVLDEVLERGIPYGYPFEDIKLEFDSEKFASELRKIGVWTADDALRNPQKLWSAMNAAFAENITNILQSARIEQKRGKQ